MSESERSEPVPAPIEGHAAFAEAALGLVRGARRELLLLSYELERRIYGQDELAEALKDFVLMSEHQRLRILLNQPRAALSHCPRLVELGRRLPSRVEFRQLPEDRIQDLQDDWLIADREQLLERASPDRLSAALWTGSAVTARQRGRSFDAIWNHAEPAQELRNLAM